MALPQRIETGIDGLDNLLDGGLPQSASILISGAAGTGKTTMGLHFLHHGLQQGESCSFVSLKGEDREKILSRADMVGIDLKPFLGDQLQITSLDPARGDVEFFNRINNALEGNVERVVIDSLSVMLGQQAADDPGRRKLMYRLKKSLKHYDTTTLLVSEMKENNPDYLSRYGVAEHEVDGVITLDYSGISEKSFRTVEIRKMEGTQHASGAYAFTITDTGISVKAETGI